MTYSKDVLALNRDKLAEAGAILPMSEGELARVAARREKELQQVCENLLRRNDVAFLHLSHRAREKAGWPDLVFVIAGIAHAVELKSATGALTGEQQDMLAQMERNGWTTYVVHSFEVFHRIVAKAMRGMK